MSKANCKQKFTSVAIHIYPIKITTTWNALLNELICRRTVDSLKTWNRSWINRCVSPTVSSNIPCVTAHTIPKVARSRFTECSKTCDLQPALHSEIRGAQGVLPSVGWRERPVNWIYRRCAIVRSWLWSTATRSSPLGYFSKLLQVVDN